MASATPGPSSRRTTGRSRQPDAQPRPALRTASAAHRQRLQHRRLPSQLDRHRDRWLIEGQRRRRRFPTRPPSTTLRATSVGAIAPTPILTAAQAGIPSALRYTDRTDIGPRLGFAWRIFGNDKTVLRGGWGRFIESPLGFSGVCRRRGGLQLPGNLQPVHHPKRRCMFAPALLLLALLHPASGSLTGTAGFYYAFPDPLQRPLRAAVESDPGAGSGPRHWRPRFLHRQPRPESRSHGGSQSGAGQFLRLLEP